MGSHTWLEQCPYCGFEAMGCSSYDSLYFKVTCPICGYARWTEERVPDNQDIEMAKLKLSEMDAKERQKAMELCSEDNIPLIARLKGESAKDM